MNIKGKIRNLSKMTVVLLLIIAVLSSTLSVLAYLWIVRQIQFTASIQLFGDFQIYEDANCTIPLTYIDYGIMPLNEWQITEAYFKNLGNTKLNITWSMTNSSVIWDIDNTQDDKFIYYNPYDSTKVGLVYFLHDDKTSDYWSSIDTPDPSMHETIISLDFYEVRHIQFKLWVSLYAPQQTFTWELTFYGEGLAPL